MKAKLYNLEAKETGEIELSDTVFNVRVKPELVHEVYVAQMNNQRQPWADTKSRAEVRGGGRKPWQQKGTGRARHGSIRSPLWKGGGVSFGPLSIRNYKEKINKKKRRLAVRMCLSDKAASGALWVVEDFTFPEAKTRTISRFLRGLPSPQKSWLILTPEKDADVLRMTNNLPRVKTARAQDLNVLELLGQAGVVTSLAGVRKIEEIFSKH